MSLLRRLAYRNEFLVGYDLCRNSSRERCTLFHERPPNNSFDGYPITHLFVYPGSADCVKYSKRCQASDASQGVAGNAYQDLDEAAERFAEEGDVYTAGISTTTSDWGLPS